jgi:hypothetical protein
LLYYYIIFYFCIGNKFYVSVCSIVKPAYIQLKITIMKKLRWIFPVLALILTTACSEIEKTNQSGPRTLEIKDGAYYINGEKTFINAIGYEIGARPGQHPYEDDKKLEIARMQNDLKIIKEAGFNGVRTWSELTEEEVQLVQESGLLLVYGIWIEPVGDFGDSTFIVEAKQQVTEVMAWSINYDCIITYLIMNEPLAGHIKDKGAQNTVDLWTGLTEIIHDLHPGIPVTISNNSAVGEYLNERIFDVYGFNTYDYNEGIPGHTQEFYNHFSYLKKMNGENKPVLVTEFGMSVSEVGWGGWYGGNTRERQASHIIQNFSDLLDSEVAGICPFYYADGWWKAGNPAVHDPWPEESFGYWGYADDIDTIGYPRPIWYEFKEYNQALVASPRNHHIYQGTVPIEFYLNEEVAQAKIIYKDKVVYNKPVSGYHFTDEIEFNEEKITDRELIVEFYNEDYELMKWESISILTSKDPVLLPEIRMALSKDEIIEGKALKAKFTVLNDTIFALDKTLNYVFAHHEGWNPGDHRTKEIETDKSEFSFTDTFVPGKDCIVLNIGAGVDIKFGKFVKRIHTQKLIYKGDWADPIKVN